MDFIIQIMPNVVDRFDVFVESIYGNIIHDLDQWLYSTDLGFDFWNNLSCHSTG